MSKTTIKTDVVIFGAGIAGLYAFHRIRKAGYSAVLLENNAIGTGQTIASQGIIHSGLKYAFTGKISKLAKSISAMPDLWRACLKGKGEIDLSSTKIATKSQFLLIPGGIMGGLIKLVAKQALGNGVRECARSDWPEEISSTGFRGKAVFMDEPVLDIPSMLRSIAEPYRKWIKKIDMSQVEFHNDGNSIASLQIHGQKIKAKKYIFTAAGSNHKIATQLGHDVGLTTQKRPLLQGMIKHVPFPLFAHLVGASDKPAATITSHKASDGNWVWYVGGSAAERPCDAPPEQVFSAIKKSFAKYLPELDTSKFLWSTLPIDRVEGKSNTHGWMPDTPSIHDTKGNLLYCWPTKLTFAPLLAESLLEKLKDVPREESSTLEEEWSFLPDAEFARTPWDEATWTTF